jgi:uncharacterized protein (TIGR04255 family)
MNDAKHLAVPAVEHRLFSRNFIKQAVCELRFPTLHEIDSPKPPLEFAHAIRKEYPTHEVRDNLKVTRAGNSPVLKTTTHLFHSKKARWSVSLRPSSLTIETSNYDSFESFGERIRFVIQACRSFIDSEFFTRIGMRYINSLPYERSSVASWINPDLVAVLSSGMFGDPSELGQQVRGTTDDGGYYFQNGLGDEDGKRVYILDFDFFAEDVEVKGAMDAIGRLHTRQYDMFMWCLGDEAKRHLESRGAG